MSDPWADLDTALTNRKREYLNALTVPFEPGKPEEELKVTARQRGYLRGNHPGHNGKRPTATDQEREAAGKNAGAHNAVWSDTPALRSALPDPVSGESVNLANARLTVAPRDPADPRKFTLPYQANLPKLDEQVSARQVLSVAGWLGTDIAADLRAVMGSAGLPASPGSLLQRVVGSLLDVRVTVAAPTTPFEPAEQAIRSLLQPEIADELVALMSPEPLGELIHELQWWQVTEFFTRMAVISRKSLREALAELADLLLPGSDNKTQLLDRIKAQPYDYAVIKTRHGMEIPTGFGWPDWDDAGVYWWRSVLLPHCVQHLLSTKDTADFHVSDLLRFSLRHHLFDSNADPRVPAYVAAAVKTSLLHFKYWWDQNAEGRTGGHDWEQDKDVEMTFWSENHQIQFTSGEFLVGQLWPDETFAYGKEDAKAPFTGRDHQGWARKRLLRWLTWRLEFGFGEWRSPGYYNEDFPPLFNLADFSADVEIKTKATMVLDLLVFDLARCHCRGSFGSTAGRAYWEHKAYGWEQSVGDTVEVLFGSRGDYVGAENTAIALCTSDYQVPHVLLAIGRDRDVLDRERPFTDRARVSVSYDEAAKYGKDKGMALEEDGIAFWWGAMAYFEHAFDVTKTVAEKYPHLWDTPPFNVAYKLNDDEFHQVLYDLAETAAGVIVAHAGQALLFMPFPISVLGIIASLEGIELSLEGIWHLLKDIVAVVGKAVHAVLHAIGLADDDPPKIPDSALQSLLNEIITRFNKGSVLTRANIVTHGIGDVMLSSVQQHAVGEFAFQKHPWQATLGPDACVWTSAPFAPTDLDSIASGWLEVFKDLGTFKPAEVLTDLLLPLPSVHDEVADMLGHDGPNYWSGSVSMPMVVQYERASIIAYNLPNDVRLASDATTHAWFPKAQFDETDQVDASGGTWTFGRKDDGFVALFSARKTRWTNEDGNLWNDRELLAEGGSNIWICHIGNTTLFRPSARSGAHEAFEVFKKETMAAYLTISGVGSWNQVHASFDIPRAQARNGNSPRLELFAGDHKGRFAHEDLVLDEFPRFENRYGTVAWGDRRYRFLHEQTGLYLSHDLDTPRREHNHQLDTSVANQARARRLRNGSLTAVRR